MQEAEYCFFTMGDQRQEARDKPSEALDGQGHTCQPGNMVTSGRGICAYIYDSVTEQ